MSLLRPPCGARTLLLGTPVPPEIPTAAVISHLLLPPPAAQMSYSHSFSGALLNTFCLAIIAPDALII